MPVEEVGLLLLDEVVQEEVEVALALLQHLFFGLEVEEVVVAYSKKRPLIVEAGVEAVEVVILILSAMVA